MFAELSPDAIHNLGQLKLFPIMEFAVITGLVMISYMGIHATLSKLHPATKFLVAMFLGVFAYSIGKVAVLSLFFGSTAQAAVNLNAF